MAAFDLAKRLHAGQIVYASWCMMASPMTAETLVREGFPAVVLDAQHGMWDIATIVAGVGAANHAGGAAIVRVPLGDFASVSRALDFGAEAIIAPMINNAGDATRFASAAKYPPLGERSYGPVRAAMLQTQGTDFLRNATDYLRAANLGTLTLAMIESQAALDNVEAIAATPGIDALFVGPYDLSTALSGGSSQDINAPDVDRAIDRIVTAAVNAGKIPGIYCRDAARALAMRERGFRFLTVGNDLGLLRDGVAAQLKALNSAF